MNSQNESINVVQCESKHSEISTDKINAEIDKAFSGITTSSSYTPSCIADENIAKFNSEESAETIEPKREDKHTSSPVLCQRHLLGSKYAKIKIT